MTSIKTERIKLIVEISAKDWEKSKALGIKGFTDFCIKENEKFHDDMMDAIAYALVAIPKDTRPWYLRLYNTVRGWFR